jgi:LacI family transcriptional regulator, repressor for deo operon, udp, cdd, tsx, nupC, and nupG
MATIKEVAAFAGVTPTTVTNVLRGKGRVSEATRQRVLSAVKEKDYRPNLNARALVEKKAPTVALMLNCITNPFYPEFSLYAHVSARRNGRFLLVCNTDHEQDDGVQFLDEVVGSLSDGVMVANKEGLNIDIFRQLQSRNIPVVISVWELPEQHPGVPCIAFDAKKAGIMATQHLLDLGHKSIGAIIAGSLKGKDNGRYQGFLESMSSVNIKIAPNDIEFCADTFDGGYKAAQTILKRNPNLSALFVSNDLPALGVLDAAHDMNIVVPKELSVVSITNISQSEQVRPALTTVAIPTEKLASQGINLLLQLKEKSVQASPMIVIDELELVVRESTARYASTVDVTEGAGVAPLFS